MLTNSLNQGRFSYALLLIFVSFSLSFAKVKTLPDTNELNYVVIGAFALKQNAWRFADYAKKQDLRAKYDINPRKELYYVYVYSSPSVDEARRERYRIRNNYEFRDAWVFTGYLGNKLAPRPPSNPEIEVVKPETEVVSTEIKQVTAPKTKEIQVKAEPKTSSKYVFKEGDYRVYFNAINTKNLKEVKGMVKVIDPVRAKLVDELETHELVPVRDPKNRNKTVKFTSNIFGFKPIDRTIILNQPVSDSTSAYVSTQGDSIIVDFELERYRKGEFMVLYRVYFFKDAAVMRSESKFELNSLLDMMMENEKLKIRLHGHTNGKSVGKIIHLKEDSKDFFALNADHVETMGSAKKLSSYRAYTIKEWLAEQGIDRDRVEIKGWGGKKMIYDKFDSQASKNVRVEVEITAE